jgi:hypothetical protein
MERDWPEESPADIEDEIKVPRRDRLDYTEREIEPESSPDDFETAYDESNLEPNTDDERDVRAGY